jgi:hypothetical protein
MIFERIFMKAIYKQLRSGLQTSRGRDESQFNYEYGVLLDSDSGKQILPGRRIKPQLLLSPDQSHAIVCEFETSLCFIVRLDTRESWPLDGLSADQGRVTWLSNSCVKWSREIVSDVGEISATHFLAKSEEMELSFDPAKPRASNYQFLADTEVSDWMAAHGQLALSAEELSQTAMSKRRRLLELGQSWTYYEERGNFVSLINPAKREIFVFSKVAFDFETSWSFS